MSHGILLPGDWQGAALVLCLVLPMAEHWDVGVSVCVTQLV